MWRKHLAALSDRAQHKSPSKEETFFGSSTLRKLQWNSRFRWSLMQILTFYLLFCPCYSSGAVKRYTIFSHARAIIALECQGDDSVLDNKKKKWWRKKGTVREREELYPSSGAIIVRGIWSIKQMGVSTFEDRKNVFSQKLFSSSHFSIPSPSFPFDSARRQDYPSLPLSRSRA